MTRRNTRFNGCIREFGNGNINIKYDPETIAEAKKDEILILSSVLSDLDCYFIGETYCLSNWATGHTVYNVYSDLVYVFNWADLETLRNGGTVKLHAIEPDETDREILQLEGF